MGTPARFESTSQWRAMQRAIENDEEIKAGTKRPRNFLFVVRLPSSSIRKDGKHFGRHAADAVQEILPFYSKWRHVLKKAPSLMIQADGKGVQHVRTDASRLGTQNLSNYLAQHSPKPTPHRSTMYKLLALIATASALGTNKKALKVRDASFRARRPDFRAIRIGQNIARHNHASRPPPAPPKRPSPAPTPRTP